MISVTQEIRTSIYRSAAAGAAHRALGATPNVHSTMPDTTETARFHAFCCFPDASPPIAPRPGKQKGDPGAAFNHLIFLNKPGAGERIRTVDPNLGKVMLYP